MALPTSSLGTPTPIPSGSTERVNGVLSDTAVGKGPQCVVRAKAAWGQPEPGGHWDTAWPLGQETVTGQASMILACSCPPPLAGRRRLRDSDEGLGAGGAGASAASRRVMQLPRFQVSRAEEDQISHCLSGLREFRKVLFPKIPAAARHHLPRPESHSDTMARHSGLARAARGTYCDQTRPELLAAASGSSLSTAQHRSLRFLEGNFTWAWQWWCLKPQQIIYLASSLLCSPIAIETSSTTLARPSTT